MFKYVENMQIYISNWKLFCNNNSNLITIPVNCDLGGKHKKLQLQLQSTDILSMVKQWIFGQNIGLMLNDWESLANIVAGHITSL